MCCQTIFVNIVIEAMEMAGALKQQGLGYRLVEGSAKGHSIVCLASFIGWTTKTASSSRKTPQAGQ